MEFNRLEAKLEARKSMRSNQPSPMLVTLVYLVLIMVVTGLVHRLTSSPLAEMAQYLYMGYEVDEVIRYVAAGNPAGMAIFGAGALLIALYRVLMSFGYTSYALRMARNQQPGYGRIFDGFARPLRVVGAAILTRLFTFLWTLLFLLPGLGVYLLLLLVSQGSYEVVMGGYFLLVGVGVVLSAVISLRYRLSVYYLVDNLDCTALESVRRSREAMKGWKMELFILDLSFLPWTLLTTLTAGVLGVWVFPYQEGTYAHFFDSVSEPAPPVETGGYMGQIYDRDSHIGPKPF